MDTIYPIAILGFGVAGQILFLELLKSNISASTILCIDKSWLGGDLISEWSSVISNTPWAKPRKVLENYSMCKSSIAKGDSKYTTDQCLPVGEMASYLFSCARSHLDKKHISNNEILSIDKVNDVWRLNYRNGSYLCKTLFLTNGVIPKSLDLPIATIPLSKALDKVALKSLLDFETDAKTVSVIGCSHSGILVLNNLQDLGISTYAIYKGEKPFIYESDTIHGGLKEQSALIAKDIETGKYPSIKLVPLSNSLEVYKAIHRSSHIVYCIGFESRIIPIKNGEVTIDSRKYSPETAIIADGIVGFGSAYPGVTVIDNIAHTNVSILAFQEQIQRCLPKILSTLSIPSTLI
jgi:hypothetical protein